MSTRARWIAAGVALALGLGGLSRALRVVSGAREGAEEAPTAEVRARRTDDEGRRAARRKNDRADPNQAVGTWDDDLLAAVDAAGETPADAELAALEALGYVAEGHAATGAPTGVVTHDASRAWPGTNLLVSAHALSVDLIDMDGHRLHTWTVPEEEAPAIRAGEGVRRALLDEDGALYVILEGKALFKLAPDSRVLWRAPLEHPHHDLRLDDRGRLHTLSRRARTIPAFRHTPVLEDRVSVLDAATGALLEEHSVLAALARSDRRELYELARKAPTDALHTNSLELLDGRAAHRNPAFAAGNYLLSSRTLDAVFVLDPKARKVVWAQRGPWRRQHDPGVLDDGTVLLFDNHNPGPSRVLIFDPADGSVVWTWEGGDLGAFYTVCCGTVERLPNGNTLVVSTDDGVAVELAPDGDVVWRYRTPHTVLGGKNIARLFDVVRAPPASELRWLSRR